LHYAHLGAAAAAPDGAVAIIATTMAA